MLACGGKMKLSDNVKLKINKIVRMAFLAEHDLCSWLIHCIMFVDFNWIHFLARFCLFYVLKSVLKFMYLKCIVVIFFIRWCHVCNKWSKHYSHAALGYWFERSGLVFSNVNHSEEFEMICSICFIYIFPSVITGADW